MADNLTTGTPTSTVPTGSTIATDDVAGVHYQRTKLDLGGDGAASPLVRGQQADAASLPVTLSTEQAAQLAAIISALGGTLDVSVQNGSIAITAASLPLPTGAATAANQQTDALTDAELRATPVPVDGSGATQPVSAVTLPLPTGAATAANQQTDALTDAELRATAVPVDGSGVTQPVSGDMDVVSQVGAGNMANAQMSVGNTATQIVAARATRRSVTIKNQGDVAVFVGVATVTTGNGIELQPQQSVALEFTGIIQGITASGSADVGVIEVYD